MNKEELNTKFRGFAADKYYTGAECHDGWCDLIYELHNKIVEIDPNYKILQIKEKFGRLRFYFSSQLSDQWDTLHNLVDEYEAKSGHICEECGAEGFQAMFGGWVVTSCEPCMRKAQEFNPDKKYRFCEKDDN